MTTNQTIDGVPREWLENYAGLLDDHHMAADANKVRALLDAPVECRCKRYGKDNPHWPCPVHPVIAAQPQGEPVAFYDKESDSLMILGHVKLADQQYVYAEQPAPVAVGLPERMTLEKPEHHTAPVEIHNGVVTGWNACLDEVTRINTK